MADPIIVANQLTKDYGDHRGIFQVDLSVNRGEVFGYVGTNGSGKTTTIRNLMGYILPDGGSASILGMDVWKERTKIKEYVSYVPGEIAFPNLSTGTAFFKLQAEYLGVSDFTYMNHLIQLLQLDPSANLKRMSKGMKQKTALVAALMADKEILVLDEPTTGLDPLMRDAFLDLVREEKAKGRTVFMSSHIFEEIEEVCDRVAMIKNGNIVETVNLDDLRNGKSRIFHMTFADEESCARFQAEFNDKLGDEESSGEVTGEEKTKAGEKDDPRKCTVEISRTKIAGLFDLLGRYEVVSLNEEHLTLETYFWQIYEKGDKVGEWTQQ